MNTLWGQKRDLVFRRMVGVARLGAVAAIALTASVAGAEQKTLKVGVLGPLSGSAAQWGVELVRGAELRAEEINAAGGLQVGTDTYSIELVPYDHKASAAEAITATKVLVFQDKVDYIVGNAIGATTSAAQTITEPEKVLFMFISYGAQALGPDKPFSFRTILSDIEVVEPYYRWIHEKHPEIRRIATLSPNDESGRNSNTLIVKTATELGLEVVAEEYYARETQDFYPLLTSVLAKKPDHIEMGASPPGSAGLIAKQLYELGYRGAKGWTSGVSPNAVITVAGSEAAENTWSPWSLNFTGPDAPGPLREFAEKYREKHGEIPGSSAIANYVALDAVTQAMQAAGTTDPEKVLSRIVEDHYDTLWGTLVVGGKETYGIDRQFLTPITISEIRDGQVVDVGQTLPKALMQQ